MIKCSECGYENMDGLDYCDGCGAKLESPVLHGPAGSTAAPQSSPSAGPGPAHANEIPAVEGPSSAVGAPVPAGPESSLPPGPSDEHLASEPEAAPDKAPTGEMSADATAPASVADAVAAPFKVRLSIIRGGRRGQEFELESGNNLVGRWDPETGAFPEVDLDADDPEAKVSRKHALIRIDAAKITIEDIGSLNGTYVNRQPRLQPGSPLDLKDGDEIIIGKTFLKLSINPIS